MWIAGVSSKTLRVLLLFGILHPAFGMAVAAAQPPPLTAPVNDVANVIDAGSKAEIDKRIRALQQTTGDVVVVATVPTFQPSATIDEYAAKMFENGGRGIGQKGKDNGALILVAVEDRKVRIEVGYDLEAFITDGFAGETIRNIMLPEFREGRYGPGVLAGTTRIISRIAQGRGVTIPDVPPLQAQRGTNRPRIPFSLIIFVIFVILSLSRGGRRRRRRTFWGGGPWSGWTGGVGPFGGGGFGGGFGGFGGGGGGGGGGGFGGFGGGRSGGGGASGGW